ncbi:MAG: protoheme IX farnesyltransferase, partial [Synechococcales cyanobacterium T60_A2020_003]|nr:protoheme IX farnesyltransferase [Synechococcales cyanobacterium T60_A2020_003]
SGIVTYVLVYTHWLKRHSTQNIVIGGSAGAIPPLVGWAAVTGEVGWPAWIFFGIIFLWTPPHFWALAMMIRDDYAKVGVPMLPVVKGDEPTAKQIWLYTLILVPFTLLLVYPFHVLGGVYALVALLLGGVFIAKAQTLRLEPSNRDMARSLFKYSILYMMLLCTGMAIDSLPITQSLMAGLADQVTTVLSEVPMLQVRLP